MMVGDECWVLHRSGEKRCGYIDRVVGDCVHVRHDDGSLSYHSPRALEAMRAVLDAAKAVAEARNAVVEAARDFVRRGYGPLSASVVMLEDWERAESEARAELEALR